jgi:hypothetical protein
VRFSTKARHFAGLAAFGAGLWVSQVGVARADLRTGLVGYWKLDEANIGANSVAADASGRQHPGTYVGGPATSTKVPPVKFSDPRSVAFVRASHHAVQISPMPTELKPSAVTLSAWVMATSTDTDRSEVVSGGDSYILYITSTGLGAGRRKVGTWSDVVAPAPGLLDGKWHHVAATIDAEALKVYLDGAFLGAQADAGPLTYDVGTDLWFGRYGYGTRPRDFEGNLDEVAIYDRVLTLDEIGDLARGAEPGVVAGPPDAGAPIPDAAPEAAAEVAPEAPRPPVEPTVDAAVEPPVTPIVDAQAPIETAPPVVTPPVVTPPPADAGAPSNGVPPADVDAKPGKFVPRYHDVPSGCAAAGRPSGDGALALLGAMVAAGALSGRRRRAPASRR